VAGIGAALRGTHPDWFAPARRRHYGSAVAASADTPEPQRRQLLRPQIRPSAILLPHALAAALAMVVYAIRQGNRSNSGVEEATSIGVVLATQTMFAALRPQGSRWLPRWVALAAAWIGVLAVYLASRSDQPGPGLERRPHLLGVAVRRRQRVAGQPRSSTGSPVGTNWLTLIPVPHAESRPHLPRLAYRITDRCPIHRNAIQNHVVRNAQRAQRFGRETVLEQRYQATDKGRRGSDWGGSDRNHGVPVRPSISPRSSALSSARSGRR